jgi:hypothetical protein
VSRNGSSSVPLADLVADKIGGLWGDPPGSTEPDYVAVLVIRGADFRDWSSRRAANAARRAIPKGALARRELRLGDLVLEVSGGGPSQPVGRVVVIDSETLDSAALPLIPSNFCRRIRLKVGANPYFVKRQLDSLYRSGHFDQYQTSTTNIRNLQVDAFLDGTVVELPALEEQERLTKFADDFDSRTTSVESHLSMALNCMQRFRDSVLVAACSGRLTSDWRASHPGNSAALIEALRTRRDGRRLAYARPGGELDFEVPAEWSMVPIELFIDRVEAGKSFTCLPRHATENEWGVIRVSAMSWGSFRPEEHKAVPHDRSIDPRHEIRRGDLLISRANTVELVGASVLVDETRPKLLLSDKSLRLIPYPEISKQWLNYALSSPMTRRQFGADATGTSDSMRNLSQKKILRLLVGLPPTNEQEEIVRRVSHLMSIAEAVVARITAIGRQTKGVSKGVFANAFQRGDAATGGSSGGV